MSRTVEQVITDLKVAAQEEIMLRESGDTSDLWQDYATPENVLLLIAKQSEWGAQVVEAARKWVKCKGRYHSEINAKALIELFEREPKP